MREGKKLPARQIDTGEFHRMDRITHRIELTAADEVDAGVKRRSAVA